MKAHIDFNSIAITVLQFIEVYAFTLRGVRGDDSGSCGANLRWFFNGTSNTLTISGTGNMTDFDCTGVPWQSFKSSITKVIISEGVTSIGTNAFCRCSKMR